MDIMMPIFKLMLWMLCGAYRWDAYIYGRAVTWTSANEVCGWKYHVVSWWSCDLQLLTNYPCASIYRSLSEVEKKQQVRTLLSSIQRACQGASQHFLLKFMWFE